MLTFIQDFGTLFLVIVAISFIVKWMKQPIIIGYVVSGLIFSFFVIGTDPIQDQIVIMSELGITFLLFLMGVDFDFKNLKYLGKDILIATLLQSVIFFVIGLVLALLFGFSAVESIYLAILFMFSSTLLVAKWIDDKKESATLHGKIVFGILIMQDVFAIIALTVLNVLQESSWIRIAIIPLQGIILLAIAFIFAKHILNHILKIAVKYPELLFILSLGVCFLFVELSPLLGYSTTIGAFIAGVVLANTQYKNDIYSRLKTLIIFFNMLFFVGLGFQIRLGMNLRVLLFIVLLCVLSLILKPIVIYVTLRLRGYDLKTSFISGLDLAQLSEFGIIIIASGMSIGILTASINVIAIITVITTMVLSSYIIKYDNNIFKFFESYLRQFEYLFVTKKVKIEKHMQDYNILFFGYYDLGKELFLKLKQQEKKVLVIENDPANIEILKKEKIPYIYNSVTNPELFEHIQFEKVELVVSSLLDIDDNKLIIKRLKSSNPKATAIVTAKSLKDSLELYKSKADYVIYPSYLNEQHVSVLLEDYTTDINKVLSKRITDITNLKEREKKRKRATKKSMFDINSFISNIPKSLPNKKIKNKLFGKRK